MELAVTFITEIDACVVFMAMASASKDTFLLFEVSTVIVEGAASIAIFTAAGVAATKVSTLVTEIVASYLHDHF